MNHIDIKIRGAAEFNPAGDAEVFACPTCAGTDTELFHEVHNVPTNSCILFDSRADAINCSRGAIALRFCHDCGFIYNASFRQDLTEYSGRYEETQGFSPTFSRFHRNLAAELVERHGLRGKDVMEIGCGKGEFLVLLSQLGDNRGVGVDPSALPERLVGVEGAERVKLVPEYFEPRHCEEQPDFLCCKMTLEHITATNDFISTIRAGLDDDKRTVVFFQVPETMRIIKNCAFEDIYHEHCSYFTASSLEHLFRQNRFDVTRTAIEYDDQYLTLEAVPSNDVDPQHAGSNAAGLTELAELAELVKTFPQRLAAHKQRWHETVEQAKSAGQTVVLWGSGSKAVSFLTSLGIADMVDFVTDINPNRHNHFMPGTGHLIVAPSQLAQIEPGLIIVMNRIYEDEIKQSLAKIGVECRVECL
jgi:SAM-dependent methyltransferase